MFKSTKTHTGYSFLIIPDDDYIYGVFTNGGGCRIIGRLYEDGDVHVIECYNPMTDVWSAATLPKIRKALEQYGDGQCEFNYITNETTVNLSSETAYFAYENN